MLELPIVIASELVLDCLRDDDANALVRHLSDGEIASFIPVLPQPYGEAEARAWIAHRTGFTARHGREISFVIRGSDGEVIGSFGFDDFRVGDSHVAEFGGWVARDCRQRGVATAAGTAVLHYGFEQLGLTRVTARTLATNHRSVGLAERLGFTREGLLRQHQRIGSTLHDVVLFGLLVDELVPVGAQLAARA